ncbi:hypothetical protein N9B94_00185 [Verrucomicrobia bacterium]|nr:hypothetical protein [Verrucomicrobiota bacterium]
MALLVETIAEYSTLRNQKRSNQKDVFSEREGAILAILLAVSFGELVFADIY